jgi:ankyrin repeat protein
MYKEEKNETNYNNFIPHEISHDFINFINNDDLHNFVALTSKLPNWDNLKFPQTNEFIIHKAVRIRANNITRYLIDNRVNFNVKESEGKSVLHISLEESLCEMIQYILRNNLSDIEFSHDEHGDNELHKWIVFHSSCKDCLSSLGKFSKIKNEHFTNKNLKGNNPLHQSVIEENLSALKLLASGKYFNFDLNEQGENGNSLLHLACYFKNTVRKK